MSLKSTADELRELAHDLRHPNVDLENRVENLFEMAQELDEAERAGGPRDG